MTFQLFSLEGKVAVVTGGTSGIGRALSLGLAEAGADVIATARRQQQVDDTAKEIEARGRKTLRVASDVGDRASLEKLLAATLERFGKVDILVNCAGMIKRTPTLDLPEEEWNNILNTNLTGTLRACQVFGRDDARARLRAHHQHRVAEQLCRAERSCSVRGEQGGRGVAHALAGRRVVEEGRDGERRCARCFPHRSECATA